MIPIPIYVPNNSTDGIEYIYPKWVESIVCFGCIIAIIGVLWMMIAFILSIITDDKIDLMEKPHIYSLVMVISGASILVIALLLMLLTGQKMIE